MSAQIFPVNTGAHLFKDELKEATLENKIEAFGTVVPDAVWIDIKQLTRRNNDFVDQRISICKRKRIDLAGKMSRLLANQDIEGLRKQLEDKRKSLELIPENLKRLLEINSYRGNFICVKTPLPAFNYTVAQQISSAQAIMSKTAISELNGAFIKSLTSVSNGMLEERTVQQWISGQMTIVGQPFHAAFSSDQRYFILASTVEVSPLKKQINSGNTNFEIAGVELCFNMEMEDSLLKVKLLETGISIGDADNIISEFKSSGMVERVKEFNVEKEQLIQNLNRNAKREMENLKAEIADLEDKISNHDQYLSELATEVEFIPSVGLDNLVVGLKKHILDRMKLFEDSISFYSEQKYEVFESAVTVTDRLPKEMARSAMGGLDQLKARKAVAGYAQYIEVKDGVTTDFRESSEIKLEREVNELWFLPRTGNGNTYNYSMIGLYKVKPSTNTQQETQTNISEIKIGEQIWMSQNLNVSTFRNGDLIPEAKTPEEWKDYATAQKPAWCYYENNPENGKIYGKLYNWYAVNDSRGLAPEGWHVPDDEEWTELGVFLGGVTEASPKMKSTAGWNNNNNGSNSSGFNAIASGIRSSEGDFHYHGENASWWTSNESNNDDARKRDIKYYRTELFGFDVSKGCGFSVRCVKNGREKTAKTENAEVNNVKVFQSVRMGTQTWMIHNLTVTSFRNGEPIKEAKTAREWKKANKRRQPVWCNFNNDPANGNRNGKLYNWYAVSDSRGLAPEGWHIPTDEEWTVLTNFLGGENTAGGKMKLIISSGATASSGVRLVGGKFMFTTDVDWWSYSQHQLEGFAMYRSIKSNDIKIYRYMGDKRAGYYVICLKD